MRIRLFAFALSLIFSISSSAQTVDALNKTDESGKKQGHWIKRFENGNIQYDGYFINDIPTGNFKRYYEDSQLRSIQVFNSDGTEADVTFYHRNGFIQSTGKYINQKKEGIWKTYSANFDKYLISEEEYSGDKRNGLSIKYYPDGSILEKMSYSDDIRQGEWIQYYSNGTIAIRSYYVNDKLDGTFEVYFSDGKPEFSGQYKDDVRDGLWHIYKEDGSLKYEITYVKGIINDPEMYRIESDYLDELEKNKGKIAEPDFTDFQ